MTNKHSIAARVSVLAVAVGACVALGIGPSGGDEQSGQLARSCEREKYMVNYWDNKAKFGEMFLFDPRTVAHYTYVANRHLNYAAEACTSG